jgi:hypothetical protein
MHGAWSPVTVDRPHKSLFIALTFVCLIASFNFLAAKDVRTCINEMRGPRYMSIIEKSTRTIDRSYFYLKFYSWLHCNILPALPKRCDYYRGVYSILGETSIRGCQDRNVFLSRISDFDSRDRSHGAERPPARRPSANLPCIPSRAVNAFGRNPRGAHGCGERPPPACGGRR